MHKHLLLEEADTSRSKGVGHLAMRLLPVTSCLVVVRYGDCQYRVQYANISKFQFHHQRHASRITEQANASAVYGYLVRYT